MTNYASLADRTELKSRLSITDTAEDADLLRALERATAWIERRCERHFSVRSETRYFTALRTDRLQVDDLLSVTTLKTDDDGDRTYENTWAAADYDLEPFNSWPKTMLRTTPNGDYSFPTGAKGIEIAGLWGHGDGESATPYEDSGTDTAEELDASETAVDVVAGTALAVGQTILVESEQMYITAIATNTITVRRGVNGTTAATHVTAKDINIYRYPDLIEEACILRAIQFHRGTDAPFNVAGGGETQQTWNSSGMFARIMDVINQYRRVTVG